MPRRLNRKGYGWSYTYGRDQRTVSDKFKENYEKVDWDTDTSGWEDGVCVFGKSKRKRFK